MKRLLIVLTLMLSVGGIAGAGDYPCKKPCIYPPAPPRPPFHPPVDYPCYKPCIYPGKPPVAHR